MRIDIFAVLSNAANINGCVIDFVGKVFVCEQENQINTVTLI